MPHSSADEDEDVVALTVGGRVVAEYDDGASMPASDSPRPHLRAWSLHGIPVTEAVPEDHPHHMNVSLALPDVSGTSFWGGRTYVRDHGSTLLDNHGVQRVVGRRSRADGVDEEVEWVDRSGARLLTETRHVTASARENGWELRWRSRLRAVEPGITLGSPHTNGRDGAFYGGVFWRTPLVAAEVWSADGAGVERAHGSASPWLAVVTDEVSLVAAAPAPRWFIRTDGYVGFGPAAVGDHRREVPTDGTLELALTVAVVDGRLAPDDAAGLGVALAGRHDA